MGKASLQIPLHGKTNRTLSIFVCFTLQLLSLLYPLQKRHNAKSIMKTLKFFFYLAHDKVPRFDALIYDSPVARKLVIQMASSHMDCQVPLGAC